MKGFTHRFLTYCEIKCDAGKVLVTEHGFTKSSMYMSILLRPSAPASWPFVILHPLTHPPHIPLYKQASPTWIAISEKLSPVSWKISPSRKMGHCGSRVLWKVQVLFKSGKMFLLHMMEGKQASLVKTGIHLFHGREPVWYLALWAPPMILPSGIHTLVYSPLTLYSVGLCDQWYMTEVMVCHFWD